MPKENPKENLDETDENPKERRVELKRSQEKGSDESDHSPRKSKVIHERISYGTNLGQISGIFDLDFSPIPTLYGPQYKNKKNK